tara:strand:+ start:129 stop:569 length:441 start_codon:yes stop_codon:yes gene_type:complete
MTEKPEEKNNPEKEIDSLKEEIKDLKKKKELEKLQSEINSLKNGNKTVTAQSSEYSDPSWDEIKSKKTTAGIIGLFFGAFGAHKFVIGYQKEGFIYLGVSVVGGIITCGGALAVTSILALIESIMLLTKTPEEFKRLYIDKKTPWF